MPRNSFSCSGVECRRAVHERLGQLGRRQLRETGGAFLDGLLSGIERKTGWMMAEQAGLARPWRMQGLLGRNRWDADALRDEVRAYAVEALGYADGMPVVDETGFVKKGRHSVGVARQYTGTAGRVENSQVGVFLAYAGRFGETLIDRSLYLLGRGRHAAREDAGARRGRLRHQAGAGAGDDRRSSRRGSSLRLRSGRHGLRIRLPSAANAGSACAGFGDRLGPESAGQPLDHTGESKYT